MVRSCGLIAAGCLLASFLHAQAGVDRQGLNLMPWPATVSVQPGSVPIDVNFSISVAGAGSTDPRVTEEVDRTFARLGRETGMLTLPNLVKSGEPATLAIVVEQKDHRGPQRLGDDERYSLEVSGGRIRLSADAPLGAIWGLQTFLQLVQQNKTEPGTATAKGGFSVPQVTIRDDPRFPWRGLSLDVSRHFIPVDEVERTLDGMSAVKLNVLHWHLSDDQGFRVESKKYPRLQKYGADGQYYTQAEIREVLAYARDRGIRVVPEFDIPGHATSWLVGYPKLGVGDGPYHIGNSYGILSDLMDPTKESTYRFLDGFIGEMAKLFPDEYFHIGGDEVNPKQWNNSLSVRSFMRKHHLADGKALQTYFNQRLVKIVTKHRKHMEGWDEVLNPNLPKNIVIQSWRGQQSLWQAAREGYQGILSAGYYLDLNYPASYHYSVDPMKVPPPAPMRRNRPPNPNEPTPPPPGTPADLTPEQQKLVLGGEAAMWEELTTPENLDAKLWPRLAAVAERFWSPESVTDVNSMYQRLAVTNKWLEWLGLKQEWNQEMMRQRLAGAWPVHPLDELASILEPVRGYARHAGQYSTNTPINRLVDSIAPESNEAREFRDAVDHYLAAPHNQRSSEALRKKLAEWQQNTVAVRPILQSQSLLTENLPVADAVAALCAAGQDALQYLDSGSAPPSDWKQKTQAAVNPLVDQRVGDILVQIAPGVQKLVDAVGPPTP